MSDVIILISYTSATDLLMFSMHLYSLTSGSHDILRNIKKIQKLLATLSQSFSVCVHFDVDVHPDAGCEAFASYSDDSLLRFQMYAYWHETCKYLLPK